MSELEFEGKSGTLRAAGYRFAQANPEADVYRPSRRIKPPRKVDLRKFMTPVENQGELSSCTANAIAGAYEYLIKRHTNRHADMSRLFIYYNARWRNREQHEDAGSVIQYGMESLQKFGACNEKTWPYKPKAVLEKPSRHSYTEAAKFKVLDMQKVNVALPDWKRCLAEGYPIVFGCVLFDTFDKCNDQGGVVPMPDPRALQRGEHGRHAMLAVGYSDIDQVFIVRNSWGNDWGDQGYCYMPYNYLMSEKLNGGDCWMLRGEDNLPRPRDAWIEDRRPLVHGIDARQFNAFPSNAYDWVQWTFFGTEEDYVYSEEVSDEYVSFYESIEEEYSYIEESEGYEVYDASEEEDEEDLNVEEEDETEEDESDEEESEDDEEEDEESSDDEEEEETSDDDEEEEESEEESEDEDEDDSEEQEDDEDAEDDEEESEEEDDEEADDSGDDDVGDEDEGDDDSGDDGDDDEE